MYRCHLLRRLKRSVCLQSRVRSIQCLECELFGNGSSKILSLQKAEVQPVAFQWHTLRKGDIDIPSHQLSMAQIANVQTSVLRLLGSQRWCQRSRPFISALAIEHRPCVSRTSLTRGPSFATGRRLQDQDASQSYEARL